MRKIFITLLVFLIPIILFAEETPKGFSKVKELGGIEEYLLDVNGLSVLLMEEHSAPVVTFMVTYRVGSRNEVTGTTGSTHLLEHLMFKGTEKYNKANGNHLDQFIGNVGARRNATTWMDRTNYYESIPSQYLEKAVDFESDRMRNLLLREEDRQSEMTVVRNEFERGENNPLSALDKAITAAAFQAHPYHHSTIGWRSDIENVPIEKLRDFYNTFYWPNNATVTVIGDFKKSDALALIKKYYGTIPRSPKAIPEVYTTEPKQEGPRRVVVKRPGQVGVVGIGYKVPEGKHEDTYALLVLNSILNSGKTSRFYKALVDKNLAINAMCFYRPFHDPSLINPFAYLAPNVTHEEVEAAFLEVFREIKDKGVSQAEVDRAINKLVASTVYDRDGSFSIASEINEAIAMGDWTFFVTFLENVKKVTVEDVKSVANKYLLEDQSTTGYFIPLIPGGDDSKSKEPSSLVEPAQKMLYYRNPESECPGTLSFTNSPESGVDISIAKNVRQKKINEINVITAQTGVNDVITFRGSLLAGDVYAGDGNSMVADLTGNMLDKGTKSLDKFQLAEKLEDMGASLSFSVGVHNLSFNGRCLTKDINSVIDILADQLQNPAFSPDELDKLKKRRIGSMKRVLESTDSRAKEKLNGLIFPEDHPNHGTALEDLIKDIEKVTIEDINDFYSDYYGPKSMIFAAVGDLDHSSVQKNFSSAFNGWSGGIEKTAYPRAMMQTESGFHVVTMEGKTSTTLRMGQVTRLNRKDGDYISFMLANRVFGASGFIARLMSTIRDKEGLTYGIYSAHDGDIYSDGYWYVSGSFSPDLLDKGITSTKRELKKWVNEGITEEEFKNIKTRANGEYLISLETTAGLARQLLSFVQRGFDVGYIDQYPRELDKVTLEQINEVLKKYIDPDQVVIVVAGSVDEEGKPLE